MIIIYDTYNEILIFKMEKKDWKNGSGKSFIKDITEQICGEDRLEIQHKKELLWNLDKKVIKKFYEIYKKHYNTKNQKVIFT